MTIFRYGAHKMRLALKKLVCEFCIILMIERAVDMVLLLLYSLILPCIFLAVLFFLNRKIKFNSNILGETLSISIWSGVIVLTLAGGGMITLKIIIVTSALIIAIMRGVTMIKNNREFANKIRRF